MEEKDEDRRGFYREVDGDGGGNWEKVVVNWRTQTPCV